MGRRDSPKAHNRRCVKRAPKPAGSEPREISYLHKADWVRQNHLLLTHPRPGARVVKVALYTRVSTDGQTADNQRIELERVAAARGWQIVQLYDDNGMSGAKGRQERKQFDSLLKAATRREFDMVAAWSVDRLGRSLRDLIDFLNELRGAGVDLYLHQQAIDTSTPAGRALFQMMGVFAEFERALIIERVRAGMSRARKQGKHLGRPKISSRLRESILREADTGLSRRAIARKLSVGDATVRRVLSCEDA
jgi:DNA invertase Pin-like site-specific DNA recombinase